MHMPDEQRLDQLREAGVGQRELSPAAVSMLLAVQFRENPVTTVSQLLGRLFGPGKFRFTFS